MSASNVKAGGVFVEIGADPRKFFATLSRVNKAMAGMGRSIASAGAKIGGMGVATLAPFAAAVRQGTGYQNVLLNIQASTGATAAELDKLRAASMAMSAAMGTGPTEIANSFLELLKAGMSVEQVLGGAGKAALEFAAVGQMDVAAAAVVMADAMNVFGVDAAKAANSISSAADASSTSIELMSQSFAQVAAVAALANQSIDDTSAALAVLANNGVKGSDAGTSLKTMLMRLMAPADDAVAALGQIGLSVASFRNADGSMKPLVEIIDVLNGALGNMDQAAKDDIFRRIFGQDAIRAAAILTSAGVEGFTQMRDAMGNALPVGEKYKVLMSGLAGAGAQVMASLERLAIAMSDAVGPALMSVVAPITGLINGLSEMASRNQEAVANIAKFGAAAVAVGGLLVGLGTALQAISFGLGGVAQVAGIVLAPLKAVAGMVMFVGMSFYKAIAGVLAYSTASVASAVASGAAWVAANAPLLILVGLLTAAGAAAIYAAGGFAGIAQSIGSGITSAAADGMTVLADLGTTAATTFNGIYEAISAGDLSGAMDVLWAGLQAGWLRGVEALMSYVDPWVSFFQNTFTALGGEIYKIWDSTWVTVGNSLRTFGAYIQGAFDNVINGVLAAWDALEAGVLKSWNYIQSFFVKGFDLEAENKKVDDEMSARARKRELERPGVDGRTKAAEAKNKEEDKKLEDRKKAVDANTQEVMDGREAANSQRADERRAATQAAEDNLDQVTRGKREGRARNDQYLQLLKDIENATSMEGLRSAYEEYDALAANGRLTSGQMATLETALEDAQERVSKASSSMGGKSAQRQVEDGAAAAGVGGPSTGEVAGTFSSVALGGMGFGSSLAQKQLDALNQIATNTDPDNAPGVAA